MDNGSLIVNLIISRRIIILWIKLWIKLEIDKINHIFSLPFPMGKGLFIEPKDPTTIIHLHRKGVGDAVSGVFHFSFLTLDKI